MDAKRWAVISTAVCLVFVAAEAYGRQCPTMPGAGDGGGGAGTGTGTGSPSGPATGGGDVNRPVIGPTTGGAGGTGGGPTTGGPKPPTTGGTGGPNPPPQAPPPSDGSNGPTTGGGPKPIGPGGPGGGAPAPAVGGGGPSTGPVGGPRTGGAPGGPTTGPAPRGSNAALAGKKNKGTTSLDRFDLWWDLNCETFLAARSTSAPQTARDRGFLDGVGSSAAPAWNTRPSAAVVSGELVPALRSALKDHDSRVRGAAAIALGQIAPREMHEDCLASLGDALASEDANVRDAALLSMGMIGDRSAVRTLWQVMNDTQEARALTNSGTGVQDKERSFAILALGFLASPDAATQFHKLLSRSAGKDVELAGCAVLGLGLLGADAAEQVPQLGELLCDRSLDRRVRSQIPVALAHIGESALPVLPFLLQFARDQKEDALVRASCVIGLGRLAATYDAEILAALRDIAHDDRDAVVRHYALLGLAQIGARATDATPKDVTSGLARFLAQQLNKPKNSLDQPWAALACGIYAGSLKPSPANNGVRQTLIDEMHSQFRSSSTPTTSGALALGLGLAGAKDAAEDVRTRFSRESDEKLRSHFALALGLLGDKEAIAPLRDAIAEDARPELRIAAARSLALLRDSSAANALLTELEGTPTAAEARSLGRAVALLRDPSTASRLAKLAADPRRGSDVRAACCEAIGRLAERSELPYTTRLTGDLNVHAGLTAPAEVIARL